jgi:cyclopropane fatty-acyl-phospholipid synthase-like methyltransferase
VGSASERLAWTAGLVAPRAGERVLEVGCGHGVLVALLAERAAAVLAVDRSPTMITAAARRNRAAVDAGRVRLQAAPLRDADLNTGPFDAVVSFNVRAFWNADEDATWDRVAQVLAPGGRVLVAFSIMAPGDERSIAEAVGRLAAARGLAVAAVHSRPTAPIASAAVEVRRPPVG